MEFKYVMNVKHESLQEFEADHCLHWALSLSTESLVSLLFLLLRVIMWEKSQIPWWKNIVSVLRKPGKICLYGQVSSPSRFFSLPAK